jgi:hypothetical protein
VTQIILLPPWRKSFPRTSPDPSICPDKCLEMDRRRGHKGLSKKRICPWGSPQWNVRSSRSFINSPESFRVYSRPRNFARDAHVENLLLFPPQAHLVETSEYSDGRVILQDKASCFPAIVLAPPSHPRSVIIDATAAPGNKTSHLSALMGNQGKVRAPHLFRIPCQHFELSFVVCSFFVFCFSVVDHCV